MRDKCTSLTIKAGLRQLAICKTTADGRERRKGRAGLYQSRCSGDGRGDGVGSLRRRHVIRRE